MLKKAGLSAAALLLLAGAALAVYFGLLKPDRAEAANIKIAMTPERIARGRYIYRIADCDGCHSQRDFSRFGGPVIEGGRGQGAPMPRELGLPGNVVAPNITPDRETGIGAWTDGEKIRAIREGISRDGTPLFPFMPYPFYREMSDEDAQSLVAYLNTLAPVRNPLPRTTIAFPVSLLIRTEPRPVAHVAEPDRRDPLAYGRYLAQLGACVECHTMAEKGRMVAGMEFAGGRIFRFPNAAVVAANITTDSDTGIGKWTGQDFVNRFTMYRRYIEKGAPAVGPDGFTIMPWLNLAQAEPEDLKAIYTYLRTVRPVRHSISRSGQGVAHEVNGAGGTGDPHGVESGASRALQSGL